MNSAIPSYIRAANIQSRMLSYRWDEWGSKRDIYKSPEDQQLRERIQQISQRGRIALATGISEWTVYRFGKVTDLSIPLNAVEAAWAGEIDRKYFLPVDLTEHEGWSGPAKGVIRRALVCMYDCIDLAWSNGESIHLVLRSRNLARYILPSTNDFDKWFSAVLEKISALSPFNQSDCIGEVVPREVLEESFRWEQMNIESLVQEFLARISPERNPFLASRQTMKDWNFIGEPYTFDINRDRLRRKEGRCSTT